MARACGCLRWIGCWIAAAPALAAAVPGAAQDTRPAGQSAPAGQPGGDANGVVRKAGDIAAQPVRDVGVTRTEIPAVLETASQAPYSLVGVAGCAQLAAKVKELDDVLGPDFAAGASAEENRAGKLAEAGGKTIVNTIIPFRGLVRELTGAAPAERRLNAAIDAGYARRGFLRGVHLARRCRPRL